jgi:hypothetical protein
MDPKLKAALDALQLFMNLYITAGVGPDGVVVNHPDDWYDDYVAATEAAAKVLNAEGVQAPQPAYLTMSNDPNKL